MRRAVSDDRLVRAFRRGDERAFEAIYDRHHRALLGFCQHMLGSREEAEDALQHVFVAAHRHLREGSGRVQVKPWLYTVARNRCLSMLRARRDEVALDHVREPAAIGATAADVECREDLDEILGDVAQLPDDQRAALVLAELGDLSHDEIAATLDVRKDKVKALIFQAREALAGRRQARAADCRDIQEQLATLRGSALRRTAIRQHVALCPACAAFEREVVRQREALALLLPVIPSAALKHSVLSAAMSSAGTGAAAAGAGAGAAASGAAVAGAGASGLAVKTLAVVTLAIGAGGGGVVAVHELDSPRPQRRPAATAAPRPVPAAAAPAVVAAPGSSAATHGRNGPAKTSKRNAAHGRSANAPGHTKTRKAKSRAHQKAEKVNRGRLRAAQRQASRPAPAKSRPPKVVKPVPPGKVKAKAKPTAPVTAHPGKDTAPGQIKSPAADSKPAQSRSSKP